MENNECTVHQFLVIQDTEEHHLPLLVMAKDVQQTKSYQTEQTYCTLSSTATVL